MKTNMELGRLRPLFFLKKRYGERSDFYCNGVLIELDFRLGWNYFGSHVPYASLCHCLAVATLLTSRRQKQPQRRMFGLATVRLS